MGQIVADDEQFETHIEADYRGQLLQQGPDSGALDAFGRQRFSQPFTLFDSMLRYSKRTDLWDEATTGGGTTNYLTDESSLELKTTVASGDTVLRRSRRHLPYQPGKSILAMASFVGNAPIAGLVQEVGYFDDDNGRGNVQTMSSGTFSSGTIIGAGLVASRSSIEFDPESGLALSLGQSIAGASDVIILTLQCSSSENATGLIGWREVV